MSSVISDAENQLLEEAADQFGGSKNFGRDPSLNGMDSFTLSVTFELDTLRGGTQALLWNTQQYGLILHNSTLYVYLRGEDGYMDVIALQGAFDTTGWHDVQVVLDEETDSLNVWVDGENTYSGSGAGVELGGRIYSDVTAGKTPWGHTLKGQIADVSISNEATDIDGSQPIVDRMYALDEGDLANTLPERPDDNTNTAADIFGDTAAGVQEDFKTSASGKLSASDEDAGESGFQAETIQGSYGTLVIDATGQWTYTVSGGDGVQALTSTQSVSDVILVKSIDGTEQEIVITVQGTDDAPVVTGVDSGAVTEDAGLTANGKLTATDKDSGQSGFIAESISGTRGILNIDFDGNWTFVALNSAAIQALGAGDLMTEAFAVRTVDGTEQTVNITIHGTDDVPVITGDNAGIVTEDVSLTTSGKLDVSDQDEGESSFQAESLTGAHGTLTIDQAGNWTYVATDSPEIQALNTGDILEEVFSVKTADGTTHDIKVTINGADESTPPVEPVSEEDALDNIAEQFGGARNLGRGSELNGMDSFTLSATFELDTLSGGTQSILWNTQQYGLILYNNHLYVYMRGSDGYMDVTVVSQAFDETGWHDVQVVVDSNSNSLNVYVDGDLARSTSAASVDLGGPIYSDVMAGQTPWGHQLKGQIADISILDEARDVDPAQSIYERMYALDQGDNAVELPDAQVDPDPANTPATVTGEASANVAEDSSLVASGKLTADDADAGESGFRTAALKGAHGTLSIDADGNWTYTGSDSAAIQALDEGDVLTETFTVQTIDGTEQTITVTIEGEEDAVVITGDSTGDVTEDQSMTTSGQLSAADVDNGESGFQAGSQQGIFGSFSIDGSGNWTYSAADTAELQALNSGDVRTETFTVKSIDGTEHVVTVNVNGSDETPVDPTPPPVDETVYTVSSSDELQQLLATTDVDGAVIELHSGHYTPMTLSGLNFSNGLTIRSQNPADKAQLESLRLENSSNIKFDALEFSSLDTPIANWGEMLFTISNGDNISVTNSVFGNDVAGHRDLGFGGLSVGDSSNITVENNEFHNIRNGAGFATTTDITFSDNYVHNIRENGATFASVENVDIKNNYMTDIYHLADDHADYIQFWTLTGQGGNKNIVIQDNLLVQSDGGDSQGIFMRADNDTRYENVVIKNNVIYQSGFHGITIEYADGVEISENTVISPPDTPRGVWIMVSNASDVDLTNNLTNSLNLDDPSKYNLDGNILTKLDAEDGVLAYSEVFASTLGRYSDTAEAFQVLTTYNAGASAGVHADGSQFVVGTSSADVLSTASMQEAYGFGGDDLLNGGTFADKIYGGTGSDTVNGGEGDDTLSGGAGRDFLTGGDGQDIFVFSEVHHSGTTAETRDRITDFEAGTDKISLQGLIDNKDFFYIGTSEFFKPDAGLTDAQILEGAVSEFGSGKVSLGKDAGFTGMDNLTISMTFEMSQFSGQPEYLLYNYQNYSIHVDGNDLVVEMRQADGSMKKTTLTDVIDNLGWHDTQVIIDKDTNSFEIWLDGERLHQESASGYAVGDSSLYDVTAGATLWGNEFSGKIADVSVLDEAERPNAGSDLVDRMLAYDAKDDAAQMNQKTGDAQARYDTDKGVLQVDVDGDQIVDMEIELVGIAPTDLNSSDFLV